MVNIAANEKLNPVPRLFFDTLDFDTGDRRDAWLQNMGVFFDLSSADGSRLNAAVKGSIDAYSMAGTVFGITTAEAQLFTRSDQRVARDAMEHFLIQVFLQGGGTTRDGERIVAGDMMIIDLDQPHAMATTNFSNLTLVLPRELNAGLSETLGRLHARRLSGKNALIRLLADHLRTLWHSLDTLPLQDCGTALKGTIGLMDLWLGDNRSIGSNAGPEVSVGLSRSILQYIDSHIDENLTPESLASIFRVSRSQLYRMFNPHDGVARYVWGRRLTKSMRMLSNPIFDHLSVGSVAYQCGFSTESHFSRSFKEKFGTSPGRFRCEVREGLNVQSNGVGESNAENADFASWVMALSNN